MGASTVTPASAPTQSGWERRQERTRRDVLAAAGEIIAADGVVGLTMRKLAARAGVAVATLYNQFGDRDGVLVAFVSNGLDQLEGDFDEQPARGPIDTTRALFHALDDTVGTAVDVWRPIFASLRSGPGAHGMGSVGDRVVQIIEHDLAQAATEAMFIGDCDVERLARHIFTARMNRLEKWATGVIEWEWYRESSDLGLELTLAAVLASPVERLAALRSSGIVS
jgi:AcrR family transcriptional regulator